VISFVPDPHQDPISFTPASGPPGRLARLGVVLDGSLPEALLRSVAVMAERVGMDAIWIADRVDRVGDAWADDAWPLARIVAPALTRARIGAMVAPDRRPAEALAHAALALSIDLGRPVELGVQGGNPAAVAYAVALRRALKIDPGRIRLSAESASGAVAAELIDTVDDLVLPGWTFDDLETASDEARAASQEYGRPATSLGIAALLPVSIGRTGAEAAVRADGDPIFGLLGHPRDIGIFGTLEECQDRVIALAHAGITDLRCVVPRAPDVHDVLAQLTAVTVGTTDVLVPGSLRSPAPPPPESWGGRPDRPPGPQISAGSRRR
jgi:alkanesulfonate monooxygenase SsuD/methylene tetrahydromethanopterin reductase-like flavin-dependent oxidoreductase (luciferase family)